jgi:hypothetical protein
MLLQKDTAVTVQVPYDTSGGFVPNSIQRFFNGGFDHLNGSFSLSGFGGTMDDVAFVDLDATDVATLGDLVLYCCDGADLRGWRAFQVVDYDPAVGPSVTIPTAEEIKDAIFDEQFDTEDAHSFRALCMVMAAILAGEEVTAAGVSVFKNWSSNKDRVSISALAGGNRTQPIFDFTP